MRVACVLHMNCCICVSHVLQVCCTCVACALHVYADCAFTEIARVGFGGEVVEAAVAGMRVAQRHLCVRARARTCACT